MPSKAETYDSKEEDEKDPYENKSLEQLEAELHDLQNSDPNDPKDWGVTAKEFDDDVKGIPDWMAYGRNNFVRWVFLGLNIFMMIMLATTPNTAMWGRIDGRIDTAYLSGFAIYMSVTWVSYLLVQGSDPGFIDQEAYEKVYQGSLGNSSTGPPVHPKDQRPIRTDDMEIELTVSRKGKSVSRADDSEAEEEEKQELEDDEEVEIDLQEPEGEDEIALDIDDEDDGAAFLTWKAWPPMRAGYCKAAKRWVSMYDHFCPFLNTPIGERNHCRFWWFLFFQCGAINWAIAICHTGFIEHTWDGGAWMSVNGHALATAFFLYLMLLFVGPLFLFHTFLAICNITTYEFLRSDEVDYLKGTQDFDLPFANSFCFNLRFFCCEQDALTRWLCFSRMKKSKGWNPHKWQRPKAIVRDSEDWYNHMWQNKYWSCC